jgi:hypothetical protein
MADEQHTHESDEAERYVDPVIEVYKKDVDRTLIRENLKLTVEQRIRNLEAFMRDVEKLQNAMREAKAARSAEAVKRSA